MDTSVSEELPGNDKSGFFFFTSKLCVGKPRLVSTTVAVPHWPHTLTPIGSSSFDVGSPKPRNNEPRPALQSQGVLVQSQVVVTLVSLSTCFQNMLEQAATKCFVESGRQRSRPGRWSTAGPHPLSPHNLYSCTQFFTDSLTCLYKHLHWAKGT